MKSKINKLISFVILFILSFICLYPNNINALTVNSDYYQNSTIQKSISLNKINSTLYVFSGKQIYNNENRIYVSGYFSNPDYLNNTIYSKTLFFDSNKNIIAECDSKDNLLGQGYSNVSFYCGTDESKFYNNKTVDDVSYYKILLSVDSPLTTDDVENYNDNSIINSKDTYIDDNSLTKPSENSLYNSYDYVIDAYDVNIKVNENNTFDITEKITAYFNVEKHGIFRTIPLKNTITRLDGTTSSNKAQISNLKVNKKYTTSSENDSYKIKIGDANTTLTGKQNYTITYTYNLGKDPLKDKDELYFNIIGTEWDTVIGNLTFTITMPKEFDSSKLGFSSGINGSTENSKIKYTVNGNTIKGNYSGILNVREALTVRCELEEGYFVGAGLPISIIDYLIFLIPISFLIISFILWYKFGRDEPVIETVEFYPPDGLNSLEVGFLYNGKAKDKDVTSLLIYLSNKGYIQIIDKSIDLESKNLNIDASKKILELQNKINIEKQNNPNSEKIKYYENMLNIYKDITKPIDYKKYGLASTINKINRENNYIIKKIKDYDGNNINEQWFMDGLFEYGRTEVTDTMLYNKFYETNNRILNNINNKENKNKIFEKSSTNKKKYIILMIIIIYFLITIPPINEYGEPGTLIFALLFPGIGFSVLFSMLFFKNHTVEKIFGLVWGLGFGGIPWGIIVLPTLMKDLKYMICYILGILCIFGIITIFNKITKRTKYGSEMLGKLRGFRNFLMTAEKDKLEAMVMQDPTYFYNILPFTYVLDVSDKWIKKFESISLQAPNWYDSPTEFDIVSFGLFMSSTMSSAQSAMSSSPSSDSSSSSSSFGSSSGGGSSGGGSGGGGGGSW